MGVLRVTGWQKGVPLVPVILCAHNGQLSQQPCPAVRGDLRTVWLKHHVIRAENDRDSGSNRATPRSAIPWTTEGAREGSGQHLRSCKSTWTERDEVKVIGKKAEESALESCGEAVARDSRLCFASTTMCLTRCTEIILLGADALVAWSILCPPYPHGSLHGTLMAFKCLACAHTILVGLVLSWKEDTGGTLTCSGSATGTPWAVGPLKAHQRVTLARVPLLFPQPLACSQRVWGERDEKTLDEALEELVADVCALPKLAE